MTFKQLIRYIIYFFLLILGNIQGGVINGYIVFAVALAILSIPLLRFFYHKYKECKLFKQIAKAGIRKIDNMDGHQFETYFRALFKELGYTSEVTQESSDFGADLIMKNDKKKVVVQAKRYGFKNHVEIRAVQEIYAAMPYYKANQSIIMTNSYYTASAKTLAKSCNVRLLDRTDLVYFINQVNPSFDAGHIKQTVAPESRRCPVCTGDLVQRMSNSGNYFMGCTNFPQCQHTENVAE